MKGESARAETTAQRTERHRSPAGILSSKCLRRLQRQVNAHLFRCTQVIEAIQALTKGGLVSRQPVAHDVPERVF